MGASNDCFIKSLRELAQVTRLVLVKMQVRHRQNQWHGAQCTNDRTWPLPWGGLVDTTKGD